MSDEILTPDEVKAMLKLSSRRAVYELTRVRARVTHTKPIPVIRIGSMLRFRKADVLTWLDELAKENL